MRSWSKHISALFILALGLIACFSPGTRDVVEDAAQRLPADTPLFGAIASPEPLFSALSSALDIEELSLEALREAGVDPEGAFTFARWPGEHAFWLISLSVADEARVEEGVSELLSPLSAAHRLVIHQERIHALLAFSTPEPEAWRSAARRVESPHGGESLLGVESLEPLGESAWMVFTDVQETLREGRSSDWLVWASAFFEACTLRGEVSDESAEGRLSCPMPQDTPLLSLLSGAEEGQLLGDQPEAGAALRLSLSALDRLWASLAEVDEGADWLHTLWLDWAEEAGVSPSTWIAEALSGELSFSLLRWPSEDRPASFVLRLEVADEALVGELSEAAEVLLGRQPGVHVTAEAFGALRGTRARWLRHRGHALSWAQHEGALYLAFGGADLEDALPADEEPPWEPERGRASLWVNLSSAMDLEGLSGGLEITLQPSEEGLEMAFHQGRESATSVRSVLKSGLSWLQGTLRTRARRSLARELSAMCDAIDLHAIDRGLPSRLDEIEELAGRLDPWGNAYIFTAPAIRRPHHRYDLCSRGPDGQAMSADDVCYDEGEER